MSSERERVVHLLKEAILSAWDLPTTTKADRRATARAMAITALARLEFDGFRVVSSADA